MAYYRKIIRITAEQSPNVRLARAQIAAGIEPTDEIVIPGVLPWADYQKRLATWDEVRKSIGLYAQFWMGSEVLLYPPEWLNKAEEFDRSLKGRNMPPRRAKGMGVDPAEGGDSTAMAAVDEYGLLELTSQKTKDTSVIGRMAIAFARKWDVPHHKVYFDRGGGGTQIVDECRTQGYKFQTVGFGESVTQDPKHGMRKLLEKTQAAEARYAYVSRRAEMYFQLRLLLDPSNDRPAGGFGIPSIYTELRRQMSMIPLLYDKEGRVRMLPKRKPRPNSEEQSLTDLMGCSPDETDALVLAVHAMLHKLNRPRAGAF